MSLDTLNTTPIHRCRTIPYIGDSDHDVLVFISNMARQIEINPGGPEAFGLTTGDLATIIAARDAYQAAFTIANNPATNSRSAVVTKNAARDEADRVSRTYAQIIKNVPGVPDNLKVVVGAPVSNERRRRNGPPGTFPYLYVVSGGVQGLGSMVKLSFRDSALESGRMPREDGITHLVLHARMFPDLLPREDDAPTAFVPAIAPMQVVAHITRNPFRLRFDAPLLARFGLRATRRDDPAKEFQAVKVMFCGQWLNAKGDVGPLGYGVSTMLPVTGVRAGLVMQSDHTVAEEQALGAGAAELKMAA